MPKSLPSSRVARTVIPRSRRGTAPRVGRRAPRGQTPSARTRSARPAGRPASHGPFPGQPILRRRPPPRPLAGLSALDREVQKPAPTKCQRPQISSELTRRPQNPVSALNAETGPSRIALDETGVDGVQTGAARAHFSQRSCDQHFHLLVGDLPCRPGLRHAPAVPAPLYELHPLFVNGLPAERGLPWHLPPREPFPPARVFTPGFSPGSRL